MSEKQPPQKSGVTRVGKAYILAMILFAVGAISGRADSTFVGLQSAGFLAALVCAVIGTVWLIADRKATRGD